MLDNIEDQSRKILDLISEGQEQALIECLTDVLPINRAILHRQDEHHCTIPMKLVRHGLIQALKVIIRHDPSILKQFNFYETEFDTHLPDHVPKTLINDIIDAVKNDGEIQIYFRNYSEDIVILALKFFFDLKLKHWLKRDPSLLKVWTYDKITEGLARRILTSGEKDCIEKKLLNLSRVIKDNLTLAMWAASMGLNDLLEVMIQIDRSVLNDVNEDGDTLAILAARKGHGETVKWLINQNSSLRNRSNHSGETPTIAAAKAGICQTLEVLLHENDSVLKDKDHNGMSPALWAANEGYVELLILMIEIIPSLIEDADNSGNTPAICAAKAGHCIVLKVLIEKFRRVLNQTNNFGQTPLMAAFEATTEMTGNNKAISRHASVVKLIYIYSETISDESNLMHAYMQYRYFPHFYFRELPMMRDIHQAINALKQALNDYSDAKLDEKKSQKCRRDICDMFENLESFSKMLNNEIDNVFPELDYTYNVCACRFALLDKESARAMN